MAFTVRVAAVRRIPGNANEFSVTVEILDDTSDVVGVRVLTAGTEGALRTLATALRDTFESTTKLEALEALIGQVIV